MNIEQWARAMEAELGRLGVGWIEIQTLARAHTPEALEQAAETIDEAIGKLCEAHYDVTRLVKAYNELYKAVRDGVHFLWDTDGGREEPLPIDGVPAGGAGGE